MHDARSFPPNLTSLPALSRAGILETFDYEESAALLTCNTMNGGPCFCSYRLTGSVYDGKEEEANPSGGMIRARLVASRFSGGEECQKKHVHERNEESDDSDD